MTPARPQPAVARTSAHSATHEPEPGKESMARVLRTRTEPWPCALDDRELADRSKRLAELCNAIKLELTAQDDQKREMKLRLAKLEADRELLADVVYSRRETRDVEVEYRADDRAGTVTISRTDTGEILSTRGMTNEERQISMSMS